MSPEPTLVFSLRGQTVPERLYLLIVDGDNVQWTLETTQRGMMPPQGVFIDLRDPPAWVRTAISALSAALTDGTQAELPFIGARLLANLPQPVLALLATIFPEDTRIPGARNAIKAAMPTPAKYKPTPEMLRVHEVCKVIATQVKAGRELQLEWIGWLLGRTPGTLKSRKEMSEEEQRKFAISFGHFNKEGFVVDEVQVLRSFAAFTTPHRELLHV